MQEAETAGELGSGRKGRRKSGEKLRGEDLRENEGNKREYEVGLWRRRK